MLDLYCERLGAGFWAEPVNAVTNLAFFLAAFGAWLLARRQRALSVEVGLLIVFIASIGIGSGLFHTLATPWAHRLDLISIFLFQLTFLWVYFRRIGGMDAVVAVVLVLVFLVIALWARELRHLLNGSLSYLPALMVLIAIGAYHYLTHRSQRGLIIVASAVFFVSVSLRSVDLAVCPYFPLGTHFFWHLLNAVVLYLLIKALVANIELSRTQAERPV